MAPRQHDSPRLRTPTEGTLSIRTQLERLSSLKLLFRHTMATLMLEGGADIRFIQEMLGHATLHATTIYTHVAIRKLEEIHTATHPGANLQPARVAEDLAGEVLADASAAPAQGELFTSSAAEDSAEETS